MPPNGSSWGLWKSRRISHLMEWLQQMGNFWRSCLIKVGCFFQEWEAISGCGKTRLLGPPLCFSLPGSAKLSQDTAARSCIPTRVQDTAWVSGQKCVLLSPALRCCLLGWLLPWAGLPGWPGCGRQAPSHRGWSWWRGGGRGKGTFLGALLNIADSRQKMPTTKPACMGGWTTLEPKEMWVTCYLSYAAWSVDQEICMHRRRRAASSRRLSLFLAVWPWPWPLQLFSLGFSLLICY